MSEEQVRSTLGEPDQTMFNGSSPTWKYMRHQPWRGFVPVYLVFSSEQPPRLNAWYVDEAEYRRQAMVEAAQRSETAVIIAPGG